MDSNTSHLLQYIDDKSDMDPLTQEDGLENSAADTACAKGQFSDDKTTASENPQDNKDDKYNPVLPLVKTSANADPKAPFKANKTPKAPRETGSFSIVTQQSKNKNKKQPYTKAAFHSTAPSTTSSILNNRKIYSSQLLHQKFKPMLEKIDLSPELEPLKALIMLQHEVFASSIIDLSNISLFLMKLIEKKKESFLLLKEKKIPRSL